MAAARAFQRLHHLQTAFRRSLTALKPIFSPEFLNTKPPAPVGNPNILRLRGRVIFASFQAWGRCPHTPAGRVAAQTPNDSRPQLRLLCPQAASSAKPSHKSRAFGGVGPKASPALKAMLLWVLTINCRENDTATANASARPPQLPHDRAAPCSLDDSGCASAYQP